MPEKQLNLFSASGVSQERSVPPDAKVPNILPAELDDDALLAAIPSSGLPNGPILAAEAGRRGLAEAVPVLEGYCRRFAGFGADYLVLEQVAALRGLATIGGRDAAAAVTRLIVKATVQGPTLKVAVSAAAHLGSNLPADIVPLLLGHADPEVRIDACRCARPIPIVVSALINLLDDLNEDVSVAAGCALGRMGNRVARPVLARSLRDAPSPEVIDSISQVADEDTIIRLGRLLGSTPALADAALKALDASSHPRAVQIIGNVRR
jgi:hypothetical protein|tara:strand:+ start:552 stop:1346 length:795 start_codon:yes stop_codon:yes gene_type:complete